MAEPEEKQQYTSPDDEMKKRKPNIAKKVTSIEEQIEGEDEKDEETEINEVKTLCKTLNTNISKTFPLKPKLKSKPKSSSKTPESNYWSSYKSHQIQNLISSIPSLAFSPKSHLFAAANSASITLFSSQTFSSTHSISSFSDVVTSCSFRSDGSLIAASDLSGLVQVFDVKTRTALRRLRFHAHPVRFVQYPFLDKLHLVSGGDDSVVKYWDVAGETVVLDLHGHKDYVRCGDCSPVNGELFVTGSYDHTVKLWDVRVENRNSVIELNHGKPVEDVIFFAVWWNGGDCRRE